MSRPGVQRGRAGVPAPGAARDRDAAARAVREHDENFPVAFALAPRDVRADMRAVYAFCRGTDDLGDDPAATPAARLAALGAWERDLLRCWDGEPEDPRLRALAVAVGRRRLDPDPFLRLIEANRMDQHTTRWETHEDLIHYCAHSATPVGRMVLGVLGYRDPWRTALSDATCEGLQLVNFWQDVRRDLVERDRIYLPREDMDALGVREADLRRATATPAVRELIAISVGRARDRLLTGAPLWRFVPRRVALDLRLFSAGGLWVCDAIARQGYDTLASRPAPGRRGRILMIAGVVRAMMRGPG
ncbi:MAG: squalene synthase HpnC [Thermoleophilia bacterium]|nr:squalene synthase HpnC [Thermoleophilia bacterium]